MAQRSYNIKDLYKEFNNMDGEFGVSMHNGYPSEYANGSIRNYCPHWWDSKGYGTCLDYHEMATSGVIHLVENLMKHGLDYDKLAEYAILFLSYKLYQYPEYRRRKINDIYTKNIEKNKYYNQKIKGNGLTCKEIINRKKDLMNTNEISKFNEAFSILCKLYNGINKNNLDCTKYPNCLQNFANKFEELNNDSNINGSTSYSKLLSTLSDDYNHLKNNYGNNNSCNFPTLPKVKTPTNKLIPALSAFSVIPVFLGIAYKTIFKKKIKKNDEENET
ncbi:PIR protein CIR protein [Plasmodium vinckei petteri]|uniref:PIR protein CIR protein n=1 Tax=Plasmodium vinckei petteri TaxID=138298 RepID=A0A6V7T5M7_PLAVN|nr:PIR protein CIR protein [Plasmodium vinckei petteri]